MSKFKKGHIGGRGGGQKNHLQGGPKVIGPHIFDSSTNLWTDRKINIIYCESTINYDHKYSLQFRSNSFHIEIRIKIFRQFLCNGTHLLNLYFSHSLWRARRRDSKFLWWAAQTFASKNDHNSWSREYMSVECGDILEDSQNRKFEVRNCPSKTLISRLKMNHTGITGIIFRGGGRLKLLRGAQGFVSDSLVYWLWHHNIRKSRFLEVSQGFSP
jgi:hypothetical protein